MKYDAVKGENRLKIERCFSIKKSSDDLKKDVESRAALVHKISFCALPNVSSKDKNILSRSHAQRLIYCIDLLIRASKIN